MPQAHGTLPSAKRERVESAELRPRLKPARTQPPDGDDDLEESPPGFLQYCWPAIFGIMLAVINQQIWDKVSTSWGDFGLRVVYPFVLLSGRSELGLSAEMTKNLPQIVQYLQFPLEGFLVSMNLRKRMKFSTSMVQIVFLHVIGAFVLWLLTKPGASHGL